MTLIAKPDRSAEFMLVKEIRKYAMEAQRTISDTTRKDYHDKYARMQRTGLLPEEIAHTKRSYYAYRSALLYCSAELARQQLRERDQSEYLSVSWQTAIDRLTQLQGIFSRYPPDPKRLHHAAGSSSFTWETIKQHRGQKGASTLQHSKKRMLAKLRHIDSWREKLFEEINAKYRDAIAVIATTGARPSEIARGATIHCEKNKNGESLLVITIAGTKVTASTGQPQRTLRVRIHNSIAQHLATRVGEQGCNALTISTHPANLCAAVIKAGRKAFPRLEGTVTPYVFRHAFASDLKAAKVNPILLAQALGHRATETQQYYGYARCGSNNSPLEGIKASAQVRLTHRQPRLAMAQSRSRHGLQPAQNLRPI